MKEAAIFQRYYRYRHNGHGEDWNRQIASYLEKHGWTAQWDRKYWTVFAGERHHRRVLLFANDREGQRGRKRLRHAVVTKAKAILFDTLPDLIEPSLKPQSRGRPDFARGYKPYMLGDEEGVLLLHKRRGWLRHRVSRDLPPKQRRRR